MPERFSLAELPSEVEVLIESARWSLVKRRADGGVDFISPLPSPYNYGCIPGVEAGDGDPLDAVVMGPRLARGTRRRLQVLGVLHFRDAGCDDPKVICGTGPLSGAQRAGLERFFRVYASFKRVLHRVRGEAGETRFLGWLSAPVVR